MSIQKLTFGKPEALTPSRFCPEFRGCGADEQRLPSGSLPFIGFRQTPHP